MSNSINDPETTEESVGGVRRAVAQAVWFLHVAVMFFLLTGWAWPTPIAWWVYALGAPLIQLGWIVFNDYCWLSILEAKLRGESLMKKSAEGDEEQRVFLAEFLESILKRPVPNSVTNWISYAVLWGGFGAACFRIYHGSQA